MLEIYVAKIFELVDGWSCHIASFGSIQLPAFACTSGANSGRGLARKGWLHDLGTQGTTRQLSHLL